MPVKKKQPEKRVQKPKIAPPKSQTVERKGGNEEEKKQPKGLDLLRGMKDSLPQDEPFWLTMYDKAATIARAYGFKWSETPVLESASLFVRSIGRGTDVVDKEMYLFDDRDGTKVALRPEFTAGIARSYITHGMHNMPQPVKVWTYGQLFRHDRPQAGRFRQFHSFGCETLGDKDPVNDAELISVCYHYLKDLGISSQVHINSIGTPEDRAQYVVELVGYLRTKRSYLSEDSKKRLVKNPLRILDSKDTGDREVIEEAPQIIDWLSAESKAHFMSVLEYLDELSIPYTLDATLVRGLDYYTDTVFELYATEGEEGSQTALGGGGRYDGLVEQLGGRPTPAAGFGIGIERVFAQLRKLQEQGQGVIPAKETMRCYVAQLGEKARRRSLLMIEQLRQAGITVGCNLSKGSLKTQLEMANKLGSTHAIILGQKEVQDGTIIIRDMESGIQEIVDQKKIVNELKRILKA